MKAVVGLSVECAMTDFVAQVFGTSGTVNINLLKPACYVMHQQLEHSTTVRSAHTVCMCFVFI